MDILACFILILIAMKEAHTETLEEDDDDDIRYGYICQKKS